MMHHMRTTLSLDNDVLDQARLLAKKGKPFRLVINEALRAGLALLASSHKSKRYVTRPHKMKLKKGVSLDSIQELLSEIDGEETS